MTLETYTYLTAAWILIGLVVFIVLFRVDAPFGRHTRSGWGPTIDNRTGWLIMEFTVLVVLAYFVRQLPFSGNMVLYVIIGLFMLHYVHRSLIFPWFLRTNGKRMPIVIVLSAMLFNTMNGFLLGYYFLHFAHYEKEWLSGPYFLVGLTMFLAGAAINIIADYQLIRLRKPGQTDYVIPPGILFRYVSCPNHMGEILEWFGFAVLSWSLPGLAFAIWTFANLAPRAMAHHRWYKKQFRAYPANRKALIPFLW